MLFRTGPLSYSYIYNYLAYSFLSYFIQWPIWHIDVKNPFLHDHLTEEIYVKQPHGFIHSSYPHYVWKLKKALYGLKQAPWA